MTFDFHGYSKPLGSIKRHWRAILARPRLQDFRQNLTLLINPDRIPSPAKHQIADLILL
jgi:hypothetical protein